MVLLVLLSVALVWGGRVLAAEMLRVPDEHCLAGLFGIPERERVLASRSQQLIDRAEAYLRLDRFQDALGTLAWTGTPVSVRRVAPGWAVWSAGDGREWRVRLAGRVPRVLRGVIVASAEPTDQGVSVAAYGPVGGPTVELAVVDVREPA